MNDPLDELLDARLREETPYIDDDGFTARVMKELPLRPRAFQLQRAIIILAAAIVSVVVAYFGSGEGMFVRTGFVHLTALPPMELLALLFVCGLTVIVASACAALVRVRDLLE
jgi:ABC-type polysaccharide/polyol phosphate export permease